MAFELHSQLESWRLRAQASSAGQFYRWWVGELVQLLPADMRARMQHASRRVAMRVAAGELEIASVEGGSLHVLEVFSLEQDARVQRQQIRDLLVERDLHEVPRDLLLGEDEVLRKEIKLPQAAESNLRQALGFEMDRHTPFKADEVYYDYRILGRDRDAGLTRIELVAAPRGSVSSAIELLAPRGMAPTGADVLLDGLPASLNLLPPDLRYRMTNRRSRMNMLMGLAAVVLLALVMAQSLWLRQHQIAEVQDAIETVRAEARLVQGLRGQIEDASEAASFMQRRRNESPPTVQVLAEVSRVLPDDTYLDRIRVWDGNVQMQGKSSNAQQLIEIVNQSKMLGNAEFRGPTRLDGPSGKEIFDLTSTLAAAEPAVAAGSQ